MTLAFKTNCLLQAPEGVSDPVPFRGRNLSELVENVFDEPQLVKGGGSRTTKGRWIRRAVKHRERRGGRF